VIGWSTDGLLALSIALPPVKTGPSETLSGLADVEAAHLLPLFRREGAPSPTVAIRRVKAGDEFRWIVDPAEGVAITAADVLVRRAEVERFERQYGFFSGLHVPETPPRQRAPAAARAFRRGTIGTRSMLRLRDAFMSTESRRPRPSSSAKWWPGSRPAMSSTRRTRVRS
jgi:hypothetical protein